MSGTPHEGFAGRVAAVTGGGSGIGLAVVQALAAEGAEVFVLDLPRTLQSPSFPISGRIWPVETDVSNERDWEAAAANIGSKAGRLDILVNCAGFYTLGHAATETSETLRRSFEVNQLGPLLGVRAMLPLLGRSPVASIVNVSSGAALFGFPSALGYMSSKWGLRGASRGLARQLAPGIRVNCVFPGLIDTPMARENSDDSNAAVVASTPLQRIGTARDVADAVLFLASQKAGFITGAELAVDGGICC